MGTMFLCGGEDSNLPSNRPYGFRADEPFSHYKWWWKLTKPRTWTATPPIVKAIEKNLLPIICINFSLEILEFNITPRRMAIKTPISTI